MIAGNPFPPVPAAPDGPSRRAQRFVEVNGYAWPGRTHVTRELATGRFPALARAVHEGSEVDAATSFATGLEWVLDAVAARLDRPPA